MAEPRKERTILLEALRSYVDLGLPIIPLCSHNHEGQSEKHIQNCRAPGKLPLIKNWREQQSTTKDQLNSWLREFKNFNVGLVLGSNSGYVGIDIDGETGEDLLEELCQGNLPDTWEFQTGAGRRLLYQIPIGLETKKFVNLGGGEHEECSILAEGQQTVMPPSTHASGTVYEWAEGHAPTEMDCADAPNWLLELIRADKQPGTQKASGVAYKADNITKRQTKPIIVSEATIPAEFIDYQSIPFDPVAPDESFSGSKVKEQEKSNEVTPEELTQIITAGGRDNAMTRIIGSFCAKYRSVGKDYIMFMAKAHNQQFCDPPLDDLAIETKVSYFWEKEQMKTIQLHEEGTAPKLSFEPITRASVALNLLEEQGFALKVGLDDPIIWITKKDVGPWKAIQPKSASFHTLLSPALREEKYGGNPQWTQQRQYNDVAHSFGLLLREQGRIWKTNTSNMDTQTLDDYNLIPLKNGKLLNWQTGELLPWDPDTNLTYVLPIDYDPDAQCPNWHKRLEEWLPDAGSRQIVQEFIGYSLIPYMGFEQALVLQGEGANGKSLFLETIQGLLGYEVVDSVSMGTLFNRFGQASLLGKILNIVNEAGSEYLRGGAADTFKNLVSGGRIKADVKNQTAISFNNTAKFIFASNHDIKTGDKSAGWERRMLLIPFEQDFRNSKEPKFEIMSELKKEHAGIFNWAVTGLRRLMANKAFSRSESSLRKKQAYIRSNDVAADFFEGCLERFELSSLVPEGTKPPRTGMPASLANYLFSEWIDYRESTVTKKIDTLTRFLENKMQIFKARTNHVLYLKKTMTECWIGLRMNIREVGFLEHLAQIPYSKYPEVQEYVMKRLAEIDGTDPDGDGPRPATVENFPTAKAN